MIIIGYYNISHQETFINLLSPRWVIFSFIILIVFFEMNGMSFILITILRPVPPYILL